MKRSRRLALTMIVLVGVVGLAVESRAATYGSFTDPTGSVSYLNVRDANGLFGSPSVSRDSLDFTPTQFEAICSQCPVGVFVSDTLSIDILAAPGKKLSTLEITEGLDYTLQSLDPAGLASVSVIAPVVLFVTELNGVPVSGISSIVSMLFSPASPPTVSGFGIQSGFILGSTGTIDIQQLLTSEGFSGDATRISLEFGNTLRAIHDGNLGSASIRKRDADFVSLTATSVLVIPEPSTAVLLMGGLALLARRRSNRST